MRKKRTFNVHFVVFRFFLLTYLFFSFSLLLHSTNEIHLSIQCKVILCRAKKLKFFFCFFFPSVNTLKIAPITAHLQPQVQTVDVDKDAQFQCIVSGHPLYEINWLHDGKPIIRDNRIEVSLAFV